MFILVRVRLAGLVQREERTVRREKTLRVAGASLVTATDRDAVYRATIAAARNLVGPESSVGVLSATDSSAEFRLVASHGDLAGALAGLSPISTAVRDALLVHGSVIAPLNEALGSRRTSST